MSFLRTLPTTRLVTLVAVVAAIVVGGTAAAVAAKSSGGTPPPQPLAQAIHAGLAAPAPTGITARVAFTNALFPSGALLGVAGSPLETGATGRLWLNATGGRLELQSADGSDDAQIVWNASRVAVYDGSTEYVFDLPANAHAQTHTETVPTVAEITSFLQRLADDWTVSGATPSDVAGRPAYTVSVAPRRDGGLLGKAELAWDAATGVPLDVAIYARGASSPALALRATDIAYGSVPDSDVQWSAPAGTKVVDLSSHGSGSGSGRAPVTGLANVEAQAGFTVVAPDAIAGRARQDARLVGSADERSAVLTYGSGLGAIVVVERKADASGSGAGMLGSVPSVSLGGVTGHVLSTELGTVVDWNRDGVSFLLAGSVTAADAQAAATATR